MGLQLSGSVQLEGNLLVTGSANSVFENISVTNRITANEINVQFVSSSIIYSSGSNKFGDTNDDKHQFTGSLDILGSAGSGISLRHSNGTNIGEFVELSGVQGGGLTLKNSVGTQHILLNAGGDSYISSSLAVGTVTPSNYAKLRVYNDISDTTYGTKIQAIFGNSDYLDSDANVLSGTGTSETQFLNGTAGRPATISLGGSLSAGEGLGLINFFRSGNSDGYRSRAYIASGVSNTGTANQHGAYVSIATTNDGDTTPTTRVTVESGGDMTIENGNLVIGTAGKGIDFSATSDGSGTMTSELLDDYEEGTFTPTYIGSDGGAVGGYATQTGRYTKIGNVVTVFLNIRASKGTISGDISIGGIPYAGGGYYVNMTTRRRFATDFQLAGEVGASQIDLFKIKSDEVEPVPVTDSDMSSALTTYNDINTTFTYLVV